MKKLTVIAVLTLMILSVSLLSGCGQDEICHTVSFDADGGAPAPASQSVLDGKNVTKPTDPAKLGYIFDGWFVGDEEWSFESDVVTADITLKAAWVECLEHSYDYGVSACQKCGYPIPEFTVTFDTCGADQAPDAQRVFLGKKVVKPQDPEKTGYVFCGWYSGGEKWNFEDNVVTAEITLKATWEACPEHTDEDKDGFCDTCKTDNPEGGFVIEYPWDSQTLIFQLTENDNNRELSSGCHRYLAGDDTDYTKAIDTAIDQRNARAKAMTGIDIVYLYWDNTRMYGLGSCVDQMIYSKSTKSSPDVYVNFMYDMVGATVKGYFANLKGASRGEGELAGLNYFEFNYPNYKESVNNRGYMYEWMNSLTLSQHKMYLLGSDYFTDIMRAAYVIPVNLELLEIYGESITGDRNNDGKFTVDDFYAQVYAGEWTYDVLMDYADAVSISGGDGVGFAMSKSNFTASGLIYSTPMSLIEKTINPETNDYDHYYPDENKKLGDFSNAVKALLVAPGVNYNVNANDIRNSFAENKILFGDIVILGSLEKAEYQSMREGLGFGVVMLPLYNKEAKYEANAPYITQIHNVARIGAIAKNTTKFVECTAYLNYQSTNSTQILDDYYKYEITYNLQFDVAQSNIEMLKYIRANIRTSFDKAMEDAMLIVCDDNAYDYRITTMLSRDSWQVEDIRGDYSSVVNAKRSYLWEIIERFERWAED